MPAHHASYSSIACILVAFTLTFVGCAQQPASEDYRPFLVADPSTAREIQEDNAHTRKLLRQRVSVRFESNKLVNVIEHLREKFGLKIFVNWANLEAAGVEMDLPTYIILPEVPLEQSLRLILVQAGAGAELEPIGFDVIEGVVEISTIRDLDRRTRQVRVYDVNDLVNDEDMLGGQTQSRHERVEHLVETISLVIDEGWTGPSMISVLEVPRGHLMIKAYKRHHETISYLLDALRASRKRAALRVKR